MADAVIEAKRWNVKNAAAPLRAQQHGDGRFPSLPFM
jgi:hypothetical protein